MAEDDGVARVFIGEPGTVARGGYAHITPEADEHRDLERVGDGEGDEVGGGNVLEALLGLLLADKMGLDVGASAPMSADAEAMRAEVRAAVAMDRGSSRGRSVDGAPTG